MYSNSNEFLEFFSVIEGIVSFFLLIIFLFLARNVSQIKKRMGALSGFKSLMEEAEKQIFYGNTDKATELYHMAAYKAIYHSDATVSEIKEKLKVVINAMNKAELVPSKALEESIRKYIKD